MAALAVQLEEMEEPEALLLSRVLIQAQAISLLLPAEEAAQAATPILEEAEEETVAKMAPAATLVAKRALKQPLVWEGVVFSQELLELMEMVGLMDLARVVVAEVVYGEAAVGQERVLTRRPRAEVAGGVVDSQPQVSFPLVPRSMPTPRTPAGWQIPAAQMALFASPRWCALAWQRGALLC